MAKPARLGNKPRAVTKRSFDNMEYDVGVAAINLDISEAKTARNILDIVKEAKNNTVGDERLLGVTRGGISMTVDTTWTEVEYDDSPGPHVGSSEKGVSVVQFTLTILEATPDNTKLAMGTADILNLEGVEIVQERDYVDLLKDYIDHFYVITRQGKDKITVLEADNVISIGGYNETKNSAGQTEIALTLQATRGDMETEGDLPYRKLFFPVGTELPEA